MQRRFFTLALVACACLFSPDARAETRLALVMGNAGYQSSQLSKLSTPHKDVQLMSDALKNRLKYTIYGGTDLSLDEMRLRINDFVQRVREAGRNTTALIFYSGHGMEVNDENFLFPVDAIGPFTERNIGQKAISLAWVLNELVGAGAAVNVVILDACRNDGTKARSKGFVPVLNPPGTIVAYATAPGRVAADDNSHPTGASPYSRVLAQTIALENVSALEVLSKVRDDVFRITKGEQTPWETIRLEGRPFAFNPSVQFVTAPERAIPPTRLQCERHQGAFEVFNVPSWDHLNIRVAPRQPSQAESSNIVAKIPFGAKGVDLKQDTCDAEGWCQVQYLCAQGYANMRYLRPTPGSVPIMPPSQIASVSFIGAFRVSGVGVGDVLNVREDPSATSAVIFTIPAGTQRLNVHHCGQPVRSTDNWCFVTLEGRQGWVNAAYLRNVSTGDLPPRQAVLN